MSALACAVARVLRAHPLANTVAAIRMRLEPPAPAEEVSAALHELERERLTHHVAVFWQLTLAGYRFADALADGHAPGHPGS